MTAHVCPECQMMHDTPAAAAPNPEIEIARINAERDKYVARVQARQVRDELETDEAIAETETEATVAAAAVEAQIIGAALGDGQADETEPEPIVIDAPAIDETVVDDDAPPPADEHSPHEPREPRKSRGIGFW